MLRFTLPLAILVVLLAAAAYLFWPRTAAHERLFDDILLEQRQPDARPTHVPPLQGSFGELLTPHLRSLNEAAQRYQEWTNEARIPVARIYSGEADIRTLQPAMIAHLARYRPALAGALRASHADLGAAPKELKLYRVNDPAMSLLGMAHAARLAALDILHKVEQGRADEAAEECADALALSRDVSYPSLVAHMTSVAMIRLTGVACGDALSAASPEVAAKVAGQLKVIRAGRAHFGVIVQRESIYARLYLMSIPSLMNEDRLLPDEALVLVKSMRLGHSTELKELLFREISWSTIAAATRDHLQAQQLPWQECLPRAQAIRDARYGLNPLMSGSDFAQYLQYHRDGLAMLDVIACLASRRAGLECTPAEPQATCGEEAVPLTILTTHVGATLSDGKPYVLPVAREKN